MPPRRGSGPTAAAKPKACKAKATPKTTGRKRKSLEDAVPILPPEVADKYKQFWAGQQVQQPGRSSQAAWLQVQLSN